MDKHKVFILEFKVAGNFEKAIKEVSQELNIPIEIKLSEEVNFKGLPKDYDIYFIHLNHLNDIWELEALKVEQPQSFFVELGRDGGYFRGSERLTRESYAPFSYQKIEDILKKALLPNS